MITNRVGSNNPSKLRGFAEIAGQRAEMFILNTGGQISSNGVQP
ncbi:hypothetical protein [Burkholderia gladioli]|nr:hypothetical protein [Burkholderia gladioli]MBU9274413.1 hypothetical protein [Burkholderia gladioli]MBU9644940.1 hypothetical protein [Burkholderia gladioli]PRE26631.1 hypothetical protein C6P72_08685 [Burkholderia gladioli]PRG51112.1 hypothetical protein C6V06_20850 [Burkholderia gladioli]